MNTLPRTVLKNTPENIADLAAEDLAYRHSHGYEISMLHLVEVVIAMHRDTQALRARVAELEKVEFDGPG